jgi:UDP-glucose 4-epimerase
MRLLVTGGAGYVGSVVAAQLLAAGHQVTVLDDLAPASVTIPVTVGPRRPGDPAILVASARRIQADLGWRAHHGLPAMVTDAWQARQAQCVQAREQAR